MARVVGTQNRSPYILDPVEALRAGERVDALLASAAIPRPRGVMRATHRRFNEIDLARQHQTALKVSAGRHG